MPRREAWKPIPGVVGYEASDKGRIRSFKRALPVVMKQRMSNGYWQVTLSNEGRNVYMPVHRAVLLAFRGQPSEGNVACHGPNGGLDNSLSNLEWGSRSKNAGEDRRRDGTLVARHGDTHPCAKLTSESVRTIRDVYASSGVSQRELARCYGVSVATINQLLKRRTWKQVAQ